MSSINFTGADGTNNWHFWLDLQNILALQNELAHILIQKWPELKEYIIANKMKEKNIAPKYIAIISKTLLLL